jgi:hypothetical protein
MAKITEKKSQIPFIPIDDPDIVKNDPLLSRAFALFDGLRKRNVGPERAAYCVTQFLGNPANGGAHPQQVK